MKIRSSFPLTSLFLLLALLLPRPAAAQRISLPQWEIRAGMGLLPTFLKDQVSTQLLPVSLELRYRLAQRFSLGLVGGHSISTARFTHFSGDEQTFRNAFTMVALRGAVHSSPWEKWEVYGGMYLGYSHANVTCDEVTHKDEGHSDLPRPQVRNGLLFSAFVGASVRAYDHVHLFGELGYGLSLTTVGFSYRF
jgi:hypothetical protein